MAIEKFNKNMAIIAALDDAFDIHIPAGEIEPENFNNATAMLALANRYRQK